MSEVVGDTGYLHANTVPFSAVITLTGASGHFSADLVTAVGFSHLLSARASVKIVPGTLLCKAVGPASASKAVTVIAAIVPVNSEGIYPKTPVDVLTIGGHAFVQHSLYVTPVPTKIDFAPEVAHQIKPKPLVGEPPCLVGHYTVTGGTSTDQTYFTLAGQLTVDGVGFAKSWSS